MRMLPPVVLLFLIIDYLCRLCICYRQIFTLLTACQSLRESPVHYSAFQQGLRPIGNSPRIQML
jgi:hypothetical protein